jgi:hypothetical protein
MINVAALQTAREFLSQHPDETATLRRNVRSALSLGRSDLIHVQVGAFNMPIAIEPPMNDVTAHVVQSLIRKHNETAQTFTRR